MEMNLGGTMWTHAFCLSPVTKSINANLIEIIEVFTEEFGIDDITNFEHQFLL